MSYLVVLLLYWGPGEQLIPITANAILHVQGGDWQNWLGLQVRAPGKGSMLCLQARAPGYGSRLGVQARAPGYGSRLVLQARAPG